MTTKNSRSLALAAAMMVIASVCPAQQLTVTPFHKSGIYDLGEPAGWNVSLPDGATAPTNHYTYTIKKNSLEVIKSGDVDLSSGKTTIETTLNEPAMLYMQISAPAGAAGQGGGGFRGRGGRGGGNTYGAAIAPTKLEPSAPCPQDFDEFWKGKLKELAKVPINPVLSNTATTNSGIEFYTVTLDSLNSHVHGYLAKPAKPGKFPAMLYYQYAGVYALDKTISQGHAAEGWLVFNVDSHDLAPTLGQGNGVPGNYQSIGQTNRETSYFLNMYLRDKRAVDYITSRPDWNGKILVAMGISMGGQQSLATAGLDSRITHAIVWVPSGADFDGPLHGHAAGYPSWPGNNAAAMEAGLYFDTVNFAPRIKATTFIAMGFRDTTASPVGIWTAFNQIKAPKEIAPMPEAAHNNQSSREIEHMWYDGSEKWLSTLVKGGKVKPDPNTVKP